MKPKTVKTTTDFVLWLLSKKSARLWDEIWKLHDVDKDNFNHISRVIIHNYAKLMATSLSLEMFVPCKDEKILDMMERNKEWLEENHKAEKKVLFKEYQWDETFKSAKRWIDGKLHSEYFTDGNGNIVIKSANTTCYLKLPASIEDLARQIELIPNDNFWKKIL